MGKKIANFMKSEIVSSVFYIAFGLCLILIPELTIHVICKIVFGVVMAGAGIYHIWIYAGEKEKATILDLFTGVITLVLGGFLFFTPQIIVKILPYLLGALVLVDNIWMLKGARKLKKFGNPQWKSLLIGSVVFIVFGIIIMAYPFSKITDAVLFAGCVMAVDGLCDIVFLILLRRGMKKGQVEPEKDGKEISVEMPAEKTEEKRKPWKFFGKGKKEEGNVPEPEIDEGENEEELENEVIINGRWKSAQEEESPGREIQNMQKAHDEGSGPESEAVKEEVCEQTAEMPETPDVVPEEQESLLDMAQEEEAEVLEEWKD